MVEMVSGFRVSPHVGTGCLAYRLQYGCRNRPPKSGPTSRHLRCCISLRVAQRNLIFFYFWRSRSLAPKASHAQRIPLNMGALHCVTGGNTRIYTARTSGEVKSMRHALRLRTTTRGFDATVELQLATSRPCPRSASAEEAGWQQARAVRLRRGHNVEVAAVSRAVASAAYLRVMGASPCASMLQRRAELTRHNSEFHAPVHGKKSEPHPIAPKPAIKNSRCNAAAKLCSG